MEEFGFVAVEGRGAWYVSVATRNGGTVTEHDVSSFYGSWEVTDDHKFFPNITEDIYCDVTRAEAVKYATIKSYNMSDAVNARRRKKILLENELKQNFEEFKGGKCPTEPYRFRYETHTGSSVPTLETLQPW